MRHYGSTGKTSTQHKSGGHRHSAGSKIKMSRVIGGTEEPLCVVLDRTGWSYGLNEKGQKICTNRAGLVQVGEHKGGGIYKWKYGTKKDLEGVRRWDSD